HTKTYSDYLQWERDIALPAPKEVEKKGPIEKGPSKAKLSYKEKKEYEEMEGKIAALEEKIAVCNLQLQDSKMATDPQKLNEIYQQIALYETQIEQAYLRWEELDKKANQ